MALYYSPHLGLILYVERTTLIIKIKTLKGQKI